jgi:hypothetical protein
MQSAKSNAELLLERLAFDERQYAERHHAEHSLAYYRQRHARRHHEEHAKAPR